MINYFPQYQRMHRGSQLIRLLTSNLLYHPRSSKNVHGPTQIFKITSKILYDFAARAATFSQLKPRKSRMSGVLILRQFDADFENKPCLWRLFCDKFDKLNIYNTNVKPSFQGEQPDNTA